jgi:hypothetical protein
MTYRSTPIIYTKSEIYHSFLEGMRGEIVLLDKGCIVPVNMTMVLNGESLNSGFLRFTEYINNSNIDGRIYIIRSEGTQLHADILVNYSYLCYDVPKITDRCNIYHNINKDIELKDGKVYADLYDKIIELEYNEDEYREEKNNYMKETESLINIDLDNIDDLDDIDG